MVGDGEAANPAQVLERGVFMESVSTLVAVMAPTVAISRMCRIHGRGIHGVGLAARDHRRR